MKYEINYNFKIKKPMHTNLTCEASRQQQTTLTQATKYKFILSWDNARIFFLPNIRAL